MATDFIEISAKEFYASRHESIDKVRPDLKQKYDDICAKYACFTQVVVPPPVASTVHAPRKNTTHPSNNFGKNHRNNHHSHSHPHSHSHSHNNGGSNPNRKPRDIHKTIMGIFNVLNKSNYGKLLTKVRLIKTESNIGLIMTGLLDTCVLQIFYLGIYMKFLCNIVDNSCEAEKVIIMKTIKDCIDGFVEKRAWCNSDSRGTQGTQGNQGNQGNQDSQGNQGSQGNQSEYSAFCDQQKTKNHIVAQNMMIIELIHIFPDLKCKFTPKSHLDNLRSDLLTALERNESDHAILTLHMLTYIVKTKRVENTCIGIFVPPNVTNKIKFMIEDLGKL